MTLGFENIAAYSGLPIWLMAVAVTWSLIWKGLALWKSARKTHPFWFVIFLLVQTLGILEILYIFIFSKIDFTRKNKSKSRKDKSESRKKKKKS